MLRRTLLLAAPATGLAVREAWAQASLRPDPTPRLPPQPGQGLPVEDARFLREAAALSSAQVEAAERAAQGATDEETRRFAADLAERHRGLAQQLTSLARRHGVPEAGAEAPATRVAEALQRLAGFRHGGDLGRDFLAAQLEVHPLLVEMYQTEASHTTDRELGRVAITAMVGLQQDFSAAARLGGQHGLATPDWLLSNPPQYGPGAGPRP
jgi:predicted outer membrane protein